MLCALIDTVSGTRSGAPEYFTGSERRDHLAGSLGRQLLDHFIAQGWLRRGSAGDRALQATVSGRRRLLPALGLV